MLGALLLLRTPSAVFAGLVPYLILFATALFACSGPLHALARRKTARSRDGVPPWPPGPSFLFYHLLVSVYGGYFGAGIGIMMLAGLGLAGFVAIHRMIALRNYYAILINGIAAAYFIFFGAVRWPDAAVLTLGQIVGSLVGARIARNLSPSTQQSYIYAVAKFSRHFGRAPDRLSFEQVRAYQLHSLERKLSWSTSNQAVCALRCFFATTLGRPEQLPMIPYGKRPKTLPSVLSPDEVPHSPKASRKNVIVSRKNTRFTAAVVLNEAIHM